MITCTGGMFLQTDPENKDYALEHGAYRTFQAETIAQKKAERLQQEKDEESNNPMLVSSAWLACDLVRIFFCEIILAVV